MAIVKLSSILKKLERFRIFELYFRKKLTNGFIWAKYEEIENFETGAGFSIFTDLTYV